MKSEVLLEDIVSVTSEAKASVSHDSHVPVNAIGWRGFGEVTLGLQAVHEGHPFGPRVGVGGAQRFCAVGGDGSGGGGGTVAVVELLGFWEEEWEWGER